MSEINFERFVIDLTNKDLVCIPREVPNEEKEVIDLSSSVIEDPKPKNKIVRIKRTAEDLKIMSTERSSTKVSESKQSRSEDNYRSNRHKIKTGRSLDDAVINKKKIDDYSRYRGRKYFDDSVIKRSSYRDPRLSRSRSRDKDRKSHRKGSRDSSKVRHKKSRRRSPYTSSRIDSKYRSKRSLDDSVIKKVWSRESHERKCDKYSEDLRVHNDRNISSAQLNVRRSSSVKQEKQLKRTKSYDSDRRSKSTSQTVVKHSVIDSRLNRHISKDSEVKSRSRRVEKRLPDNSMAGNNPSYQGLKANNITQFGKSRGDNKNATSKTTVCLSDLGRKLACESGANKFERIGSLNDFVFNTRNTGVSMNVKIEKCLQDSFIPNTPNINGKSNECDSDEHLVSNGVPILSYGDSTCVHHGEIVEDIVEQDCKPLNFHREDILMPKCAGRTDIETVALKNCNDLNIKTIKGEVNRNPCNEEQSYLRPEEHLSDVNKIVELKEENGSISKVAQCENIKSESDEKNSTSTNIKQEFDDAKIKKTIVDLERRLAWRNDAHKFKRLGSVDDSLIGTRTTSDLLKANVNCKGKSSDDSAIPYSPRITDITRRGSGYFLDKDSTFPDSCDIHLKLFQTTNLKVIENQNSREAADFDISKAVKPNNCLQDSGKMEDTKFLGSSYEPSQTLVSENKTLEGVKSTCTIDPSDGDPAKISVSVSKDRSDLMFGDRSIIKKEDTLKTTAVLLKQMIKSEPIQSIGCQIEDTTRQDDRKITRTVNLGNLTLLTPETGGSKIVKLNTTIKSNDSCTKGLKGNRDMKTSEAKEVKTATLMPIKVEDLRHMISDRQKRKLSSDIQPPDSLVKKAKHSETFKVRSSGNSKIMSFTALNARNSESLKHDITNAKTYDSMKVEKLDSKHTINKISHVKDYKQENKKISDGNKVNSSVDSKSKSTRSVKIKRTEVTGHGDHLKRKVSESSTARNESKKMKTSLSMKSGTGEKPFNLNITASVNVKEGSSEKSHVGNSQGRSVTIETVKLHETQGTQKHFEDNQTKGSNNKDHGKCSSDKNDLRSKLTNNTKAKETISTPFMQDFDAVLDCEETALTQQVKKRWGCAAIPSPEINLTCSNYWRKHQKGKGTNEQSILEGYHRYSPLIERLMGTDLTTVIGKLGNKRKRQNTDVFVDPSDGYRWDGKRPRFDNQSSYGSHQVTASLYEELKKAEDNFRVRYQEVRDHQDNQTNMLQWQYERRCADLEQRQTQEMQCLYSNSYDVHGLHSPFYSLRNKHRDQLYNLQHEHNRNLSSLEDRMKRRICEERKTYSDIEGQLQQLVTQEERRADKVGPKVPYKTVRLAKAPCRANRQTKSWVELFLPEDIGAAMIQEDLIYDTFYKY